MPLVSFVSIPNHGKVPLASVPSGDLMTAVALAQVSERVSKLAVGEKRRSR